MNQKAASVSFSAKGKNYNNYCENCLVQMCGTNVPILKFGGDSDLVWVYSLYICKSVDGVG